MLLNKLRQKKNNQDFGKLGRLKLDSRDFQPSLRTICILSQENNRKK